MTSQAARPVRFWPVRATAVNTIAGGPRSRSSCARTGAGRPARGGWADPGPLRRPRPRVGDRRRPCRRGGGLGRSPTRLTRPTWCPPVCAPRRWPPPPRSALPATGIRLWLRSRSICLRTNEDRSSSAFSTLWPGPMAGSRPLERRNWCRSFRSMCSPRRSAPTPSAHPPRPLYCGSSPGGPELGLVPAVVRQIHTRRRRCGEVRRPVGIGASRFGSCGQADVDAVPMGQALRRATARILFIASRAATL